MKAHDVRHLRVCVRCEELGDGRRMLALDDGLWHDRCVIQTRSVTQILQLPAAERAKITLGAAGPELARKLLDASHLELVQPKGPGKERRA